jgi:4-oxalocrotonate tautomerase
MSSKQKLHVRALCGPQHFSANNQANRKGKSSAGQGLARTLLASCKRPDRIRHGPEQAWPRFDILTQGHEGRKPMPLIQVRVIKDVFSKEQKRQIISKLTDAMVSIEGEAMRGVTWCVVEEVESGDWGIGGNALTTADVHALARGKAA